MFFEKYIKKFKKFLKKEKETIIEEKKPLRSYEWIDEKYFDNLPLAERQRITKECENYIVQMTPVEYLRFTQFKKDHYANCRHIFNGKYVEHAVPVRFQVVTEETGIGVGYSAICQNCKKCEDITDYDCW